MGFIDVIKEKAKQNVKTIVLPETEDKRTYEAAEAVLRDGTANLILIGSKEEIEANGSVLLTGTDVDDAKAGTMTDEYGNSQNVVELTMTSEGAKKFADATRKAYENS